VKVEQKLTKLYYSIGEVAVMFDVSNSLIRYWETEFSSLKPKKNRKGDRQFQVKDIEVLERIYTLVKERGFTIEGARKEMRKKPAHSRMTEIKKRLTRIRKGLEGIKNQL